MALESTDGELWGRAKYEGDDSKPWNALVKGEASPFYNTFRSDIWLVITENKSMNITKLIGTYANGTIEGEFIRVDYRGKKTQGSFNATWLSDDLEDFRFAETDDPPI